MSRRPGRWERGGGVFLVPSGLRLRPDHGKTPPVPAPANEEQRGLRQLNCHGWKSCFHPTAASLGCEHLQQAYTGPCVCSRLSLTPAHLPEDESGQVDFRKPAE